MALAAICPWVGIPALFFWYRWSNKKDMEFKDRVRQAEQRRTSGAAPESYESVSSFAYGENAPLNTD